MGDRLRAIWSGAFETEEQAEEFRRSLEEIGKNPFDAANAFTRQTNEAFVSDLLIRDVPEALRQDIARAAKSDGKSLSSTAIDLLREGLLAKRQQATQPRRSAWEMLRSAFEETGGTTGEFAEIMDEIEAERKRDFGRPLPFGSDDDQ